MYAVKLKNFSPPRHSIEILRVLEEIGFSAPLLKGGALRDMYLGIPQSIKDYDIWANFGTVVHPRGPGFRKQMVKHIENVFPGAVVMEDASCGEDWSEETGFAGAKIEFAADGRHIDLYVSNIGHDVRTACLASDAPLNCIAMDRDGNTYAHSEFEDHARKRLYKPHANVPPEYLTERFKRLSLKIDGLVFVNNIAEPSAIQPVKDKNLLGGLKP